MLTPRAYPQGYKHPRRQTNSTVGRGEVAWGKQQVLIASFRRCVLVEVFTTTGVSYHLEELIKQSRERLVLISPFLRLNTRMRELLEDRNRMKNDIRVVYGKSELKPEENNWLEGASSNGSIS